MTSILIVTFQLATTVNQSRYALSTFLLSIRKFYFHSSDYVALKILRDVFNAGYCDAFSNNGNFLIKPRVESQYGSEESNESV